MNSLQGLRICRACLSAARTPPAAAAAGAAAAEGVRFMNTQALVPVQGARARPAISSSSRRALSSAAPPPPPPSGDNGNGNDDNGSLADDDPLDDGLDSIDEDMSEFHRQRLAIFEEDRRTQQPVFEDLYPRIRSEKNHSSIPNVRKTYSDPQRIGPENPDVTIYGRVRSKRKHGNRLLFLDVVNEFERLQVMVNFKKCVMGATRTLTLEQFRMFLRLIEVGDHISVTGRTMMTETGELTLDAHALPQLLSPALEQLPTKLTHNRMRRRHVDLLVNQEATDILRLKAHITKFMRDHFHARRFLEYQTPILAERAGGALARPFTTESTVVSSRELQMRIAPELWLKRLVIGGVDKVFEIGPVFRNEGVDADHNPEFTMCEFYSAYMNLEGLVKETEDLVCGLAEHCAELVRTQLTSLKPPALNLARPFRQVEFVPGLEAALGFRLPKLSGHGVFPELIAMLRMAGIVLPGEQPSTLPKLLDRLSAIYLEGQSFGAPLFITNYPSCMSPLAKSFVCRQTFQLVSARTELFINGREIANMYEEENDPAEQSKKLRAHREMNLNAEGAVVFDKNSPSLPPEERLTPDQQEVERLLAEQTEAERAMDDTLHKMAEARRNKRAREASAEGRGAAAAAGGTDDAAAATKEEAAAASESADPHASADGEVEPLDQSYVRAMRTGLPPTGGWGCGIERLVMLFSGANRISDCFSFGSLRNVVAVSSEERAGEGDGGGEAGPGGGDVAEGASKDSKK